MGKGAGWPRVQSAILLCCVFFLPVWSNLFLQESIIGVGGCSGVYALKAAVRNKENTSPIFCCRQVCEVLEKKELPLEQVAHRRSSLARFQLRKGGIQKDMEKVGEFTTSGSTMEGLGGSWWLRKGLLLAKRRHFSTPNEAGSEAVEQNGGGYGGRL